MQSELRRKAQEDAKSRRNKRRKKKQRDKDKKVGGGGRFGANGLNIPHYSLFGMSYCLIRLRKCLSRSTPSTERSLMELVWYAGVVTV
mgnify:CR=1 FL=1